jgi:hypothetical protein
MHPLATCPKNVDVGAFVGEGIGDDVKLAVADTTRVGVSVTVGVVGLVGVGIHGVTETVGEGRIVGGAVGYVARIKTIISGNSASPS